MLIQVRVNKRYPSVKKEVEPYAAKLIKKAEKEMKAKAKGKETGMGPRKHSVALAKSQGISRNIISSEPL